MAKAKMQKMRKMQKTQKMKKLRKMQKTRKMKGGGLFDGLTKSVSSAYEKGKDAASKLKEETLKKGSELGNKVYEQGLDVGNKVLEKGSAMFEEAKNKIANTIIEKLEPALEKGKDRLGKFLVSMGLGKDESNKAIEAISEGNMKKLQENEGLQTLAKKVKENPEEFAEKAAAVKEELPEAQTVEVAEVVAEVAEVVEDAEDAEAEVDKKEMSGGDITTMVGDTIEDVFTLLMCIVMYGPFKGIEINNRMAELTTTKRAYRNIAKRDAEREEDELAGGKRKKNKPVKSRKNRKSKKSKSAKKH
tara:strand:+ start:1209 stop:2117 length:909 start_codon:yes stop_codon:yes gene_type:complete